MTEIKAKRWARNMVAVLFLVVGSIALELPFRQWVGVVSMMLAIVAWVHADRLIED